MSLDVDFWKDVLWHRNVLEYKHHSGQQVIQKAFEQVENKLFVANCSRRFGKTYWVIIECIRVARSKPRAKVKIATAFLTDLEEFILPAFENVLDDCPQAYRPKYLQSKKKYFFHNGSEIQLIGLDRKPNAGRGNYCDLYVFDEAAYIKNLTYIYSSVVVPMTMYREGARVIMISTPPKSPDHDFKDFCLKAEMENAYVKLDIYKNPMVTPQMIEEYKAECLTITDWEREYLCEFATDETLSIIPEMRGYDYTLHKDEENYQYYHKYVGMDLGVRDLNVTLFAYYDFKRGKICIEREDVMSGPTMTTEKLRDRIVMIENELWQGKTPYKRVADNNNPLLLLDLGSIHNLFFHSTTKDNLHAMINNLREWIKNGRVEIHESCKFLIDSLKYGLWNEKRSEFARSKLLGHYDAIAALMYLVRNIDEHTNPIPTIVGFDDYYDGDNNEYSAFKVLRGKRK